MIERVKIETKSKRNKAADDDGVIIASPHRGPPKKYDPKTFPRTAKFLAQRGATQAEIADCFGVTTRTLQYWLMQYPELQEAIRVAHEAFDTRVERALAERAIGYSVDVEELFVIDKKIVRQTVRKHYPPDVTAAIYWTKNRMPDRWRDVQRHEVNTIGLKSSEELRQALLEEFKDLVDQGLLALPAPER